MREQLCTYRVVKTFLDRLVTSLHKLLSHVVMSQPFLQSSAWKMETLSTLFESERYSVSFNHILEQQLIPPPLCQQFHPIYGRVTDRVTGAYFSPLEEKIHLYFQPLSCYLRYISHDIGVVPEPDICPSIFHHICVLTCLEIHKEPKSGHQMDSNVQFFGVDRFRSGKSKPDCFTGSCVTSHTCICVSAT